MDKPTSNTPDPPEEFVYSPSRRASAPLPDPPPDKSSAEPVADEGEDESAVTPAARPLPIPRPLRPSGFRRKPVDPGEPEEAAESEDAGEPTDATASEEAAPPKRVYRIDPAQSTKESPPILPPLAPTRPVRKPAPRSRVSSDWPDDIPVIEPPEIAIATSDFFGPKDKPSVDKRVRIVAAAVVLVLIAGSVAFFLFRGGGAKAQVFRYAFKQGDTRSYRMSMEMSIAPKVVPAPVTTATAASTASAVSTPSSTAAASVKATATSTVTAASTQKVVLGATLDTQVTQARADGSAIVQLALHNIKVTPVRAGTPSDLGPINVTVAPDGRVSNIVGRGGPLSLIGADLASTFAGPTGGPTDGPGSQLFFPTFSSAAIKTGAQWSTTSVLPLPFGRQSVTVSSSGRHDGFTSTSFGKAARIHESVVAPMGVAFKFADMFLYIADFADQPGVGPRLQLQDAMRRAIMTLAGKMTMNSTSLVLPDTGELVQLDGTGDVKVQLVVKGAPAAAFKGKRSSTSLDAQLTMSMVRLGGKSA